MQMICYHVYSMHSHNERQGKELERVFLFSK
jgi:hypothetical protein